MFSACSVSLVPFSSLLCWNCSNTMTSLQWIGTYTMSLHIPLYSMVLPLLCIHTFRQDLVWCLYYTSLVNIRNKDCEIRVYMLEKIQDSHALTIYGKFYTLCKTWELQLITWMKHVSTAHTCVNLDVSCTLGCVNKCTIYQTNFIKLWCVCLNV